MNPPAPIPTPAAPGTPDPGRLPARPSAPGLRRSFTLISGAALFEAAATGLLGLVVAHLLRPAGQGLVSRARLWQGYAGMVDLGLLTLTFREVVALEARGQGAEADRVRGVAWTFQFLLAAVVFMALLATAGFLGLGGGEDGDGRVVGALLAVAAVEYLLSNVCSVADLHHRSLERFPRLAAAQMGCAALNVAVTAATLAPLGPLAPVLGTAGSAGLRLWLLRRRVPWGVTPAWDFARLRRMVVVAAPLALSTFVDSWNRLIDRTFIVAVWPHQAALGLFSGAGALVPFGWSIFASVGSVFQPRIFRLMTRATVPAVRATIARYNAFLALLAAAMFAAYASVVPLFYGHVFVRYVAGLEASLALGLKLCHVGLMQAPTFVLLSRDADRRWTFNAALAAGLLLNAALCAAAVWPEWAGAAAGTWAPVPAGEGEALAAGALLQAQPGLARVAVASGAAFLACALVLQTLAYGALGLPRRLVVVHAALPVALTLPGALALRHYALGGPRPAAALALAGAGNLLGTGLLLLGWWFATQRTPPWRLAAPGADDALGPAPGE